jgi:hypothetical protein
MKIGLVIVVEIPDDLHPFDVTSVIVGNTTSDLNKIGATEIRGVSPVTMVIEDSLERVIKAIGGEVE